MAVRLIQERMALEKITDARGRRLEREEGEIRCFMHNHRAWREKRRRRRRRALWLSDFRPTDEESRK